MATADAIVHSGATPVFVDVDPHTFTMSPDQVNAAMGPNVKAIIPVHMYGHPADLDPISEIAEAWDAPIIEDAAHAHGASYKKKRCGSFGLMACFSFYPSKNLGAFGDGGLITTDDEQLADRLMLLRQYGEHEKNRHELVGFNSRLDALQAAVLRHKLRHLDGWNRTRREVAETYNKKLKKSEGLGLPTESESVYHVYHIYAIHTRDRDSLRMRLSEEGIETGVHYPVPIHLQRAYSSVRFRSLKLDVTEDFAKQTLSLPMYPELSAEEIDRVCEVVNH